MFDPKSVSPTALKGPVSLLVILSFLNVGTAFSARATVIATSRPCPLANIKPSRGMVRADVESRVAAALGIRSEYSVTGNGLAGGVVRYTAGACVLRVVYRPGEPAPLVSSSDGATQHLQARDETVESFELKYLGTPP